MPPHRYQPGYDPGRNLNPPGKPAGLRTAIESRFGKQTADCWDYLASVLYGTAETVQEKVLADGRIVEYRVKPTIAERAAAAELILAYAHGRPTQNAVIKTESGAQGLEDTELADKVKSIMAKHAAQLPPGPEAEATDASWTPTSNPEQTL